ncbi:MAG: hypothetical protein Q9169_001087 [Polycauliona sp. 2 TL-2023]
MPQHVIDEESHPGVLADMLHSSSSSSSSGSSSSSDTDGSSRSHTTAKRIKRVLRGRRRRKSSASSKDTPSVPSTLRTPSASTFGHAVDHGENTVLNHEHGSSESVPQPLGIIASGDEADTDGESRAIRHKHTDRTIKSRDFQKDKRVSVPEMSSSSGERKAKKSRKSGPQQVLKVEKQAETHRTVKATPKPSELVNDPEQVFVKVGMTPEETSRRPFGRRGISNVLPALPAMPRMLSTTVFSAANPTGLPSITATTAAVPANSLHRSTSLPSRLNRIDGANAGTTAVQTIPYVRPITAIHPTFDAGHRDDSKKHLSRTSAIVLLLGSTALVAVCADFLVESINYLVDNTGVNEAFIGLIVLPIVGNAAEHVTAVIAAGKNKMDLAIGIAVGSSIQIALFVTPVIVLLGWILQKEMSLYFSIFETVSLFVSAFIINFLILDGKSNYLEGALLIAAYVIIALAAFFYPESDQQSSIGGGENVARFKVLRGSRLIRLSKEVDDIPLLLHSAISRYRSLPRIHPVLAAVFMNVLPSIFSGSPFLHDHENLKSRSHPNAHSTRPRTFPTSPRLVKHLPTPASLARQSKASNQQGTPPFLAKCKKRALSKLATTNLPPLTGQPPIKRPRHRLSPQRILDHSLYPPALLGSARISPNLQSHDSSIRPSLPFRLSASNLNRKMLPRKSKGIQDDGRGGLRTLKLARASFKPGNSTGGPRTPGAQSSTSASSMDIDEVSTSPGLPILANVGLTEFLELDERPTFVIDLADRANFEPGPLNAVFANVALRSSGMYEMICGKDEQVSPGLAAATAFSDFKAWATSYVKNHQSLDIGLPSFFYLGVTWTCCTLRKRLRLIKGTLGSGSISSNPPSVVSERDGHRHTSGVHETTRASPNEPLDYFGNFKASLPALASPTQSSFSAFARASSGDISKSNSKKGWGKKLSRRSEEGLYARTRDSTPRAGSHPPSSPLRLHPTEGMLKAPLAGEVDKIVAPDQPDPGYFDWTRLPVTPALPPHIQFTRSIDWASTKLGPVENWSTELRSMCNLIMASPHPSAMYWGEDLVAIYNEAYILLAGEKHPSLMGQSYKTAWAEIWSEVKDVFQSAVSTGQATMKDDDGLFIQRSGTPGYLEETYFSWSIIPIVGSDGSVVGLFNPAFEKTRRKVAERRMLTLREVGERTAAARDLSSFWQNLLEALAWNTYDAPFVMIYSVADDPESDAGSMSSGLGVKQCTLECTLGVPEGHQAGPARIDLRTGEHFWGPIFRQAMKNRKPLVLQTENGTLDADLLQGIQWRGFGDECRAAVCCPIHLTSGESILGFLLMGLNPRRPYDDDYSLFVQLLCRQLSTSVASVVLFEEEIARGQRAAQLAALDRNELSEQLAIQTQQAVESETKFTRMAEFAPVGIFTADEKGHYTYCNDTFYEITRIPKGYPSTADWMNFIKEEDQTMVKNLWSDLVHNTIPFSREFRFKAMWEDPNGNKSDTWVIASAFPEKDGDGRLKVIFGSITNISQQKWAEHLEKRKMEEAVEMKRQQENFIDITSHEMRNPLSAILQCSDEIATTLSGYRSREKPATRALESLLDSNIDAAQTIALCAQHQKRIVDDILTLSKLDSALLLVTPCDVMPVSVVQRALKMFDGEVQTAKIKLDFKVDESLKHLDVQWVRLDPSRLLQVLINLTTNAIKFTSTQARRTITVTLAASLQWPSETSKLSQVSYIPCRAKRKDLTEGADWGNGEKCYLYFEVKDTGRGLSKDETQLLFHRFSQASPRTHVQYGGSGLGLFISRELVELQGGQIGVSSEAGKGSTFAFYITSRRSTAPQEALSQLSSVGTRREGMSEPPRPQPLDPTPLSPPFSLASPKPGLKVLIVEDNLVNQRVLQRQLRNIGCTVVVANHGGECLSRLRESTFWRGHGQDALDLGVILMDLEMPIMDGLTCAREIRRLERTGEIVRHVPIIAVTANARSEQIQTALTSGMDDVVSKPFRIPDLIPKIELLQQKHQATRSSDGDCSPNQADGRVIALM